MGAFKRVIVGVDGSENSLRAVETVKKLLGNGDLAVTLVHVVQPVFDTVGAYGHIDGASLLPMQEERGRTILSDAKGILEKAGVACETQLVIGGRGEEICNLANSGEYDLVVVGRRGLNRIEELLLGSVSSYVVRHSRVPVMVVQ